MSSSTKGKQGTKGQKQIYEENVATKKFYLIMAAIGTISHFAVNFLLFYSSTSTKSWIFYVISVISQCASIQCMRYMSKPFRSDTKQLLDAGLDLNLEGGFGEYCKDMIILSTIVQILTIISTYFWLLYFSAPVYAFYKLWTSVLSPWFFAPAPEGDDEADEKKKRKRERKIVYKH